MTSRTPSLLEQYLKLPPEASLIVLTSILGASTNWLAQNFLCSLLPQLGRTGASGAPAGDSAQGEDAVAVVLVSFLRDYKFWKDGASRLGLDLDAQSRNGNFVFVDGLTELFSGLSSKSSAPSGQSSKGLPEAICGHSTHDIHEAVHEAITKAKSHPQRSTKVVLILDNPDVVLAASGSEVSSLRLQEMILYFREQTYACIVNIAADEPLIAAQSTPLEQEHAAFALSLAHEAELVMALRMLDTGAAKDVSGVIRITRGGSADVHLSEGRELLYFVGGDGAVRVFERG